MAIGQWEKLTRPPLFEGQMMCFACGDWLYWGEEAYCTDNGTYCSEGCADDYESHNDGIGGCVYSPGPDDAGE